jgi:hypothetical protein
MIPFVRLADDFHGSLCFTAAQLRASRRKMQADAILGIGSVWETL